MGERPTPGVRPLVLPGCYDFINFSDSDDDDGDTESIATTEPIGSPSDRDPADDIPSALWWPFFSNDCIDLLDQGTDSRVKILNEFHRQIAEEVGWNVLQWWQNLNTVEHPPPPAQ